MVINSVIINADSGNGVLMLYICMDTVVLIDLNVRLYC